MPILTLVLPVIGVAKEILSLLKKLKDYADDFSKEIKQLERTLKSVVDRFEKETQWELDDDRRAVFEDFHKTLIDGKTLVDKCEKAHRHALKRIYYCPELKKLNETILSFFQTVLQFDIWANTIQALRSDEENKKMHQEAKQQRQLIAEEIKKMLQEATQPRQLNVEDVKKFFQEEFQQFQQKQQGLTVAVNPSSNKGFFAVPEVNRDIGLNLHVVTLINKLFAESVTLLGLFSPPGSGKSTLAAKLCWDKEVRGKFQDKIFFVTVSRTSNTLEILSKLVEEIGGEKLRSDLSEEDAIKQFHELLKERTSEPLLLVLDDVVDETIIKKFFFKTEGFKILVTSRKKFEIYDSTYYELKPLDEKDSETLFHQIILSQDGNEEFVPDQKLLKQIVSCCNGFPLVISVIAKSLSLQPIEKWTDTASKLSKHSSNLSNLATSLDTLDDIVLKCFLDLGSFSEDKWIPVSTLIDIWCEIYELDDKSVLSILLELASISLINLVGIGKFETEKDYSFNEVFVIQHDVLRELAICRSRQQLTMDSTEGLHGSLRKEENHYLGGRFVSLGTGEISRESLSTLQPSVVEALIINIKASEFALPQVMEKMINLKVLIIVNHEWTRAKLSNLITLGKLANLKRIRLDKLLIPSLHEITLSLMNLHKISLFMCDFDQSLMNCTIDASSELPNLVEISIEYCHKLEKLPPWICDIINLQTLSITSCDGLSELPEKIGCLTNLKLLRLQACTGLLGLPDSISGLLNLRILDISVCSSLEMLPDEIGKLPSLERIDMRGCINLSELPSSAMNPVCLKEVICCEDTARLWEQSSGPKITVPKKVHNLEFLQNYHLLI